MARLNIVAQTTPGAYPVLPLVANSQDLAFTGIADQTDRETPLVDKKTFVLAWNTDVSARTITFDAVAETVTFNRDGDIGPYSIGADEVAMFGPFRLTGFNKGTATAPLLFVDVESALVRLAVITLP